MLFDGVQDKRVPNTGIVVRGGVFQEVGADLEDRDLTNARVVQLTKDDTVLPGLFDLHAHFGIDLFGAAGLLGAALGGAAVAGPAGHGTRACDLSQTPSICCGPLASSP